MGELSAENHIPLPLTGFQLKQFQAESGDLVREDLFLCLAFLFFNPGVSVPEMGYLLINSSFADSG